MITPVDEVKAELGIAKLREAADLLRDVAPLASMKARAVAGEVEAKLIAHQIQAITR